MCVPCKRKKERARTRVKEADAIINVSTNIDLNLCKQIYKILLKTRFGSKKKKNIFGFTQQLKFYRRTFVWNDIVAFPLLTFTTNVRRVLIERNYYNWLDLWIEIRKDRHSLIRKLAFKLKIHRSPPINTRGEYKKRSTVQYFVRSPRYLLSLARFSDSTQWNYFKIRI